MLVEEVVVLLLTFFAFVVVEKWEGEIWYEEKLLVLRLLLFAGGCWLWLLTGYFGCFDLLVCCRLFACLCWFVVTTGYWFVVWHKKKPPTFWRASFIGIVFFDVRWHCHRGDDEGSWWMACKFVNDGSSSGENKKIVMQKQTHVWSLNSRVFIGYILCESVCHIILLFLTLFFPFQKNISLQNEKENACRKGNKKVFVSFVSCQQTSYSSCCLAAMFSVLFFVILTNCLGSSPNFATSWLFSL